MNFLNASFHIGRLFDINIRIHILFLIYIAWRLLGAGSGFLLAAIFMAVLFTIVLIHEFGHCFGARSVGGDARDILMWPLGGLAYAHAPMRPWPQFVTVAAGPLTNLIFCLISGSIILALTQEPAYLFYNPFQHASLGVFVETGWLVYLCIFYHFNFMLLSFNLLPIYPLDGGQLFQTLLWPFFGLRQATIVACYVGIIGCMALGVWGLQGGGQMLFFIAIFGGFTCFQRLKMVQYGMIQEDPAFTPYNSSARRGPGLWSRLKAAFRRRPRPSRPSGLESPNPNPGGWTAKMADQERLAAEVDRILKKVSEHGMRSLTYIERQTLERASRQRQQEEREFQRDTRL
jgi:Zn-dependent protease